MISEIKVEKSLKNSSFFGYAAKLPIIESRRFGSGLTMILGPNASGKSTLLSMLAHGCLAAQTGSPLLGPTELNSCFDIDGRDRLSGLSVIHDGQVLYADSRNTMVSAQTAAALSSDFFHDALRRLSVRKNKTRSHGEACLSNMDAALQQLWQVARPELFEDIDELLRKRLARYKRQPDRDRIEAIRKSLIADVQARGKMAYMPFPEPVCLLQKQHVGDFNRKRLDVLNGRFSASIPKGKPTILMDEPEANLSLPMQAKMWSLILNPKVRDAFQIVVVSHSLFAIEAIRRLGKDVDVIETEEGYVERVLSVLKEMKAH